ncbi:MAG: GNAT family protein [Ginsengibacter sp.]
MIKGNLVGLRAIEVEDLKILRDWRNIVSFRKNFREFRELNMANQQNWYNKISDSTNNFMFMIERLEDKEPLGVCGLLYINWIIRSSDYSFYIGYNEEYIDRQGYAEEASHLLIDHGFKNLNLNKIWMELYEFDKQKNDFFTEKFSFKRDAVLRQNCFEDGRYYDSVIISLLRDEHINNGK